MNTNTPFVRWDKKYGEWATHFPDDIGEYGEHLIVGHTTGISQHRSMRNAEKEAPYTPAQMRQPKPLKFPK